MICRYEAGKRVDMKVQTQCDQPRSCGRRLQLFFGGCYLVVDAPRVFIFNACHAQSHYSTQQMTCFVCRSVGVLLTFKLHLNGALCRKSGKTAAHQCQPLHCKSACIIHFFRCIIKAPNYTKYAS